MTTSDARVGEVIQKRGRSGSTRSSPVDIVQITGRGLRQDP